MMTTKVEICELNSNNLLVLEEKEMKELIVKLQHGDYECKETFIKVNSNFILNLIKHFNCRGKNEDDLFKVGCTGLMKSIDNFDSRDSVKFSTYAVPIIIEEIRTYLKEDSPIRVSRALSDIAYSALHVREELARKGKKEPTVSQIAKELELAREDVVFALDTLQDSISLLAPIFHDGRDSIYVMNKKSDIKNIDDSPLQNISVIEAMKNLNHMEKLIFNLRFLNGRTQMEVADEIGISKENVSRLEKTALKHVRKYEKSAL